MGSGTVWPTCKPAATCVSVAFLPRLRQIAARPASFRSMPDCAPAPEHQISAAQSTMPAAVNLFAPIALFATVDLLSIRSPVTTNMYHYKHGFGISAGKEILNATRSGQAISAQVIGCTAPSAAHFRDAISKP